MKTRSKRSLSSLVVLVPMMMLSAGCAVGPQISTEAKVQPSASFLAGLATEYRDGIYGQNTRECVKDWVAQNEPEKDGGNPP